MCGEVFNMSKEKEIKELKGELEKLRERDF